MKTLLFFLFITIQAHALFFPSGRKYPDPVELSEQMLPTPPKQKFGSCHIHAAVEAAEGACYRKTHEHFDISTGYQFYRHNRELIENPKSYPFVSPPPEGTFSNNDGGFYEDTIDRIRSGNVMLSSQFSMKDFSRAVAPEVQIQKSFARLTKAQRKIELERFEQTMRLRLSEDLDLEVLASKSGNLIVTPSGYEYQLKNNPDNPLSRCDFDSLKRIDFEMTAERAVALIANGIPFLCKFFTDPDNKNEGQHIVLFVGYEFDQNSEYNVSFSTPDHDSKSKLDKGWSPECTQASVVYNAEESELVEQLIKL
jgi:hypothetical protein